MRHYLKKFGFGDFGLTDIRELLKNVNSLFGDEKLEDFVLQKIDEHLDMLCFSDRLLVILRDVKATLKSQYELNLECHRLDVTSWKLEVKGLYHGDLGFEKYQADSEYVLEFSLDSGKTVTLTAQGSQWRIVGTILKYHVEPNMVMKPQ